METTITAAQFKEYLVALLQLTSVQDGEITATPSAEALFKGFKAIYGEEGLNLLSHLLIRTHNAIQREAEEFAKAL